MRATVDSNIWVSAVISRHGSPARLEAAFRAGRFTVITSDPLLDEVEGALLRPRLAARFAVTPEKVAVLLALLRDRAELVSGDADLHDPAVVQYLRERGVEILDGSTVYRMVGEARTG